MLCITFYLCELLESMDITKNSRYTFLIYIFIHNVDSSEEKLPETTRGRKHKRAQTQQGTDRGLINHSIFISIFIHVYIVVN